jgi:hypothetical protein
MDEAIGFLESEFDRAVTGFGQAAPADNVVPIDTLRSQATLREPPVPRAARCPARCGLHYRCRRSDHLLQRRGRNLVGLPASTRLKRKLFWPDGTPLPHDQCPMAVALKEDRAVRGLEAAAERPDGTHVPFSPTRPPFMMRRES